MKTEQEIKHANAASMAEYNKTMDNILTMIKIFIEKGWADKLKEKLLGSFIDWWDEQIEIAKKGQKEWDATFK